MRFGLGEAKLAAMKKASVQTLNHARPLEGWSRAVAIGVELSMGISAIFGACHLLVDAQAFGAKTSWLSGSPFSDYTIPGLYLGIVIGGGMVIAAGAAWRRSCRAASAALVMGLVMLAWLVVETAIVGFRGWQQIPLLAVCGACGLSLAALGGHSLYQARVSSSPPS
jgi:hypothetical protein